MTGTERRKEARYQRRKAKRLERKRKYCERYDNLDVVIDGNNIYQAYRNCYKGYGWKEPAQRFRINLLKNIYEQKRKHVQKENLCIGFNEFNIRERGKMRHIRAVSFRERVAQRTLTDYALVPLLQRSLIYDNGASIKNKGNLWALKRVEAQLHKFYRQNGYSNKGCIAVLDLTGYFDNIRHKPLMAIYRKEIQCEDLIRCSKYYIDAFDKENASTGNGKSVGIGSQISQVSAVRYPSEIDHYIKEQKRCKYYERYMDDSEIIHQSKEFLHGCVNELRAKYAELGVQLNKRKTQIIALSKGFTFMKTKFYLTASGKVVKKPERGSITRERRKLKKQFNKLANGEIEFISIKQSFNSWEAHMRHKDSYRTVTTMKNIFNKYHKEAIDKWQIKQQTLTKSA